MIPLSAPTCRFEQTSPVTQIVTVDPYIGIEKLQFKITVTRSVATKGIAVYLDQLLVQQQHQFGTTEPVNVDAFKNWQSLRYEGPVTPGQLITLQFHVNELPGPYEHILIDTTFRGKPTEQEKRLDDWYAGDIPEELLGTGRTRRKGQRAASSAAVCPACKEPLIDIPNYGMCCPKCFDRPMIGKGEK